MGGSDETAGASESSPAVERGSSRQSSNIYRADVWATLSLGAIMDGTNVLVTPYLARHASSVGLMPIETGALFSALMVGALLMLTPATHVSRAFASRKLLSACGLAGALLSGLFALVLPALERSPRAWLLVALTIRGMQGAVYALCEVDIGALLMHIAGSDKPELAALLGSQATVRGVALLVAPVMGGWLYSVGGFRVPGVVAALALLGAMAWVACSRSMPAGSMRAADGSAETAVSPWTLMALPAVAGNVLCSSVCAITYTSMFPTFPVHARDRLEMGVQEVGYAFGVALLAFTLAAPLLGQLGVRTSLLGVFAAGTTLATCALAFTGPPAWIHTSSPTVVYVAMVAVGAGQAAIVCGGPAMLGAARQAGMREEDTMHSVSYLQNMPWAVGSILGPLLGACLVQAYGYVRGYCTFMLLFTSVPAGLLGLVVAFNDSRSPCEAWCWTHRTWRGVLKNGVSNGGSSQQWLHGAESSDGAAESHKQVGSTPIIMMSML